MNFDDKVLFFDVMEDVQLLKCYIDVYWQLMCNFKMFQCIDMF